MYQWMELITLIYDRIRNWFGCPPHPPLIINLHVPVMIHDIVIIIWEDHIYDEESLVRYKNTLVLDLIIDVEPMDVIICVVSGVLTLLTPWSILFMVT